MPDLLGVPEPDCVCDVVEVWVGVNELVGVCVDVNVVV